MENFEDGPGVWHPQNNRGKGPKNYRKSDERTHEEVCEALLHSDEVDANEIEVAVSEGLVTLEGTVNAGRDRRRVEELIEDLPGVRRIHNHLTVRKHVQGWISDISEDWNNENNGVGSETRKALY